MIKKDKEMVDKFVGKAFIMNNTAFNVIQSPPFIAMCKAIYDYWCATFAYLLDTSKKIGT